MRLPARLLGTACLLLLAALPPAAARHLLAGEPEVPSPSPGASDAVASPAPGTSPSPDFVDLIIHDESRVVVTYKKSPAIATTAAALPSPAARQGEALSSPAQQRQQQQTATAPAGASVQLWLEQGFDGSRAVVHAQVPSAWATLLAAGGLKLAVLLGQRSGTPVVEQVLLKYRRARLAAAPAAGGRLAATLSGAAVPRGAAGARAKDDVTAALDAAGKVLQVSAVAPGAGNLSIRVVPGAQAGLHVSVSVTAAKTAALSGLLGKTARPAAGKVAKGGGAGAALTGALVQAVSPLPRAKSLPELARAP
eukprot:scaffold1.g5424.t1